MREIGEEDLIVEQRQRRLKAFFALASPKPLDTSDAGPQVPGITGAALWIRRSGSRLPDQKCRKVDPL
jgi:hypothetical protein